MPTQDKNNQSSSSNTNQGGRQSDPKSDPKSDKSSDKSDKSRSGQGSGEGRGFAGMDPERQREIASEGGRAAHEQGTAHEFDSEEAREAGKKSHMNDPGRQGSSSSSSSAQGGKQSGGGSSSRGR